MKTTCVQCGLPVPPPRRGPVVPVSNQFCCYGCQLTYDLTQQEGESGKAQTVLIRLGMGIFFAMNVMLFSLPTYSSFFYDAEVIGSDYSHFIFVLRLVLMAFATPVFLLLGLPILLNSLSGLNRSVFNVDSLIALGTLSAFSISVYNTFAFHDNVYFDTATMLLVLVTFGRYLEARAKVRTSEALTLLVKRHHNRYAVVRGQENRVIESDAICVGDLVKILPGEMIPVDGKIEQGTGAVNEASLTGEAMPVTRKPGDQLASGAISVDGTFLIRTIRIEAESTMARIAEHLQKARESQGPMQRTVDRVAARFVPAVVLIAVAAFVFWNMRSDVSHAVMTALAVLVVSCPCALGIATPVATWTAFAEAFKRGILIRDAATLEALAGVRSVFFDKTGTLTRGVPVLSKMEFGQLNDQARNRMISRIASLASNSSHPLSRSLNSALNGTSGRIPLEHPLEVETYPGYGISGHFGNSKQTTIYLGSQAFMKANAQRVPHFLEDFIRERQSLGETAVFAAEGHRVFAGLTFTEQLRPEALTVLTEIASLGNKVTVLTGDPKPPRSWIGDETSGLKVLNGLSPEEKARVITSVAAADRSTAMVGDGINDAPALALSDVGIAVGTGADLAREAARVNIPGSDLLKIPWLLKFSKLVVKKIKQNLFWAFFYNALAIAVALSGRLNPLVAAIAMILSSLFVIWNSRRLKTGSELP